MKLHLPKLLLVAVLSCTMAQASITNSGNDVKYTDETVDSESLTADGRFSIYGESKFTNSTVTAGWITTDKTASYDPDWNPINKIPTLENTNLVANGGEGYFGICVSISNTNIKGGSISVGAYTGTSNDNVQTGQHPILIQMGSQVSIESLKGTGSSEAVRLNIDPTGGNGTSVVTVNDDLLLETDSYINQNATLTAKSIKTEGAIRVKASKLVATEGNIELKAGSTVEEQRELLATMTSSLVAEKGSVVLDSCTVSNSTITAKTFTASGLTTLTNTKVIADFIEGNVSGATVSAYTEGRTVVEISGVDTLKDITLGSSLTMETGKTLTLDGKIDVANIDNTESIDETYLDTKANEGNNGFLRDAGSIVTVVDNASAGTLEEGSNLVVTMGTRTGELNTTTGRATFMGDVNYATYYINELDLDGSEHQVKVSEIQDASDDKTERVVMAAGTLEADEAIKVSATGGDLIASAMVEIEDQRTRSISMFDSITLTKAGALKGNAATKDFVVDTDDNANVEGDLSILDNGSVTLNDGKVLSVKGSLTLGNGVDVVLTDGDYGVGDKLLSSTGTLTMGDVTLVYNDSTVELELQGNSLVLVSKFKQDKADAVAQGNWGIASASRAFVNTVRGQHSHTGCIANGRGTVWAAAFGAYNDMDGADINVKGAAVGVDTKVGSCSTVGLAVGYADGEVSPTGLRDVDQEGTYVALYGEHGLKKLSSTSCLSLDWVAAYGNTESEWNGMDWEQDSLQLNTRLNWNKKLTDRLCMSVFGGLEYFASESDTVNGVKTGSIQNLRGEIGVGARYVAWGTPGAAASYDEKGAMVAAAQSGCEKLVLHGEIRYMNDLVRSNPVIRMNGLSGDGENPGRQGMGIEAGATYRIGERWSASANYGFNTMEDSKEHRVNVGASYTF